MPTHVQRAYSETSLLTIPNVRVRLRVAVLPKVLSEKGIESEMLGFAWNVQKTVRVKLMTGLERRDWRAIRANLLNLDFNNLDSVCEWLSLAGYVAQASLESPPEILTFTTADMDRMTEVNRGWRPELVTPAIRQRFEKYRDVFRWMMQLEERQFHEAIRAAREFREEQQETDQTVVKGILFERKTPRLKDPAVTFLKELRAPNLDASVLGLALRGTSESERLAAHLDWDDEGFPTVVAYANSPLESLCVSIHIDHFSLRRTVQCPCGKWFDQIRGRDRFCSDRHRNFYGTRDRRKKVSLVKQAAQGWSALPAHKKATWDRAEWIVARVSKQSAGEYALERSWVRKVLGSSVSKNQRTSARHKKMPTAKAVTRKGRAERK